MDTTLPAPRTVINALFRALSNSVSQSGSGSDAASSNPLKEADPAARPVLLTLHALYPNEFIPALDLLDRRLLTKMSLRNGENHEAIIHAHGEAEAGIIHENAERPPESRPEESTSTQGNVKVHTKDPQHIESISHDPLDSRDRSRSIKPTPLFFVRSAQSQNPRFPSAQGRYHDPLTLSTHYEVRLTAWNCSCPAFAFAAFPSLDMDSTEDSDELLDNEMLDFQSEVMNEAGGFGTPLAASGGLGGLAVSSKVPPVCKHLLACSLVELCPAFAGFAEVKEVTVEEMAGWTAGWGD